MRCLAPISLKNETISEQMKFGGRYRLVPCGKCEACIDTRRKEWLNRLREEYKSCYNAYFITLTYDEENLPRNSLGFPTFNKRDVQLFMKRLRKYVVNHREYKYIRTNIRYFIIGEYGSKFGRPHYHGILFNVPSEIDCWKLLYQTWQLGRIHVGSVTDASIGYCANYMYGKSEQIPDYVADDTNKLPLLSSRRPGIGDSYLSQDKIAWHKDALRNWYQDANFKYALPRFWKDKIFDDIEKLKIFHENQQRIKDEELKELEERLQHYQRYGYNTKVPLPSMQKKSDFIRKFHRRIKKHHQQQINNEL